MNGTNAYTVTVNGVPYLVEMECLDRPVTQQIPYMPYQSAETVRQAPWVTAQRTAHLPPR